MKIRWREHELVFVTMSAIIFISSYLWFIYHLPAEYISMSFAGPFIDTHTPFSMLRNAIIPDMSMCLVIYAVFLFINRVTIRRLLLTLPAGKKQKISAPLPISKMGGILFTRYAWLLLHILIIVLVLGIAVNIVIYYKYQWQLHDINFPGFFGGGGPDLMINIPRNFLAVLIGLLIYGLYVAAREIIIHYIEAGNNRRDYRALICNQVTAFLTIYLVVPLFIVSFRLVHEEFFFLIYFSFILPVFLVYISNTYWLFPWKAQRSFFSGGFLLRLIISTLIYTTPFVLLPFHEGLAAVFLGCWAAQLFVITPITWLLYQQKKDKILQLRGVEKALVRSKADLQSLRAQINPHFLFNTLNTLYGTALMEKAEHTAEGVQRLGDMMRFMLQENNLDFIPMQKEIEYLKNYIALQKLRVQSSPGIQVEDTIQEQGCGFSIAPMLLIPFVENAFKHGISLKELSWINIRLRCDGRHVYFEVRNSVHVNTGADPERDKSGIGLENVRERLIHLYPGKHELNIEKKEKEFNAKLKIEYL